MQMIYQNLPEDLKYVVERHRYNKVVNELHQEFRAWQHFAVMDNLKDWMSDWSLYESPSDRLLDLVNADRHALQHGHTDLDKYVDHRQVLLMQFEHDAYEFGVTCQGCVQDGSFPCRDCSQGPLRAWVCEGCFDHHNFNGWPVEDD